MTRDEYEEMRREHRTAAVRKGAVIADYLAPDIVQGEIFDFLYGAYPDILETAFDRIAERHSICLEGLKCF